MAFITNLTKNNLEKIILNYNILDFVNCTPIYEGIQNSNYIINTKNKKYILTIFEDNFVVNNINFYLNLLLFYNKYNISCPKPIIDNSQDYINFIDNKPTCLFSFINGKSAKNISIENIKNVGNYLAKLHLITIEFKQKIKTRFDINFYNNIINNYSSPFTDKNKELIKIFNCTLNSFINLSSNDIPKGIIHGDLFPDNVLFNKDNEVSGFLDFYFANFDYLISDLAIVVISWCFSKNVNNNFVLDLNKVKILINSYNDIRPIQSNELSALIVICKIYCMRFIFTRIIAKNNKIDENKIFTKDPQEYINKLLYIYNNINFEMINEYE